MTHMQIKKAHRPIYLGVAFWGKEFRESFVNYCLASLLAEGNIPALSNVTGENRFLIYTRPEDWIWVEAQPLVHQLKHYMKVDFTSMDFISEEEFLKKNNHLGTSKMYYVTQAHCSIVRKMYTDQAVGGITYPDTIYANNALSLSYEYIMAGKTAVLIHFPRFATTDLIEDLKREGYLKVGHSLSIAARNLIKIALRHLHIDVVTQQWELPYLPELAMEVAWALPENSGFIFHPLCLWYVFINYSKLSSHNTDCLDDNTIDGTYMYRNLKKEEVYLITDSDKFTAISFSGHINRKLTKMPYGYLPTTPFGHKYKINYLKQLIGYNAYRQTDPFKLQFTQCPIYLHAKDLTPACFVIEKKAAKVVKNLLEPPSMGEGMLLYLLKKFSEEKILWSGKILNIFSKIKRHHRFVNFFKKGVIFFTILCLILIKYVFSFKKRPNLMFPILIEKIGDPNFKGQKINVRVD